MFGSPASSINDSSYEYCYLLVAMKSGHIQFWKISSNEGRIRLVLLCFPFLYIYKYTSFQGWHGLNQWFSFGIINFHIVV